jgi:hypothetical protein
MAKDLIADTREQTSVVRNRLLREWEKEHSGYGRYLWHYTDARGLTGILEKGQLWASNAYYLNDASELKYGRGLVIRTLQARQLSATESSVKDLLFKIEISLQVADMIDFPYVSCFCEEGDLLSQWRAYGNGGSGYALGFHPADLTKDRPYLQLRKVIYEEAKQNSILEKTFDEFIDLMRAVATLYSGAYLNSAIRHVASALSDFLREYVYCFKHPDFHEEREWRLVRRIALSRTADEEVSIDNLSFRPSGGLVVPYVEQDVRIELPKINEEGSELRLPIGKIHCGPTLDPKLAETAIRLLLRKCHYPDTVEITSSTAPLVKMR